MTDIQVREGGLWGGIVVFSTFFVQVVIFGSSQSIGVYNIEFLRTFDTGAAAVSLVGAINLGLILGAGPISSYLMAKWSHRQVALLGATLSNIGLICMPFAPNLPYMYAFYGVLGGLGYSLLYVSSFILSGLYYYRHRSLATGIATAGSGMGSTLFPIFVYHCIQYYGWRGSLLILAGFNLHLFIFAALLRPVPNYLLKSYELQEKTSKDKAHVNGDRCSCRVNTSQVYSIEDDNDRLNSLQDNNTVGTGDFVNGYACNNIDDDSLNVTNHVTGLEVNCNMGDSFRCMGTLEKVGGDNGISDINDDGQDKGDVKPANDYTLKNNIGKHLSATRSTSVHSIDTPKSQGKVILSKTQQIRSHLKMVFTFDFSVFWLSNFCWDAAFGIALIFFPKYMTSVGISEENASIAFSTVGAGNCIGCVVGGLLGNINCCDRVGLYIGGNIGAGVFTLLVSMSYFHTFLGLTFLSSMVGFTYGIVMGLLVVLTSDLLGTAALGYGYGYLMLANGAGVLCGPPLAGTLIDNLGNLNPALYLAVCFALLGGIIMAIVPLWRIYCNHVNKTKYRIDVITDDL